jgi:hypothetical protein
VSAEKGGTGRVRGEGPMVRKKAARPVNPVRIRIAAAIPMGMLALAACRPVESPAAISDTITPSHTSILFFPTRTRTFTATATASPTEEPTQTFTAYPSFDVRNAVVNTPAEPARCPELDPGYQVGVYLPSKDNYSNYLEYLDAIEDPILLILNEGASPRQVADAFNAALEGCHLNLWDVTGDGVPEMVIYKFMFTAVLGCREGRYQELLDLSFGTMFGPRIYGIGDMNLNSTPDIVFWTFIGSGWNLGAMIMEWNGEEFVSLIQADHGGNSASTSRLARILHWYERNFSPPDIALMNGMAGMDVRDLDGNGTKELILRDSGPSHPDTLYSFGPWRGKQVVFSWDGLHYLYSALEMDPPLYRFQAVQDADRFFLMGDFARAERMYEDVISSPKLEWWTPDRVRFLLEQRWAEGSGRSTPVPPEEDVDEYPRLSAYAGYRLILMDAIRGDLPSAEDRYAGLLKLHPYGSDGYPYALLAGRFLGNFRLTHDPVRACERVVEYAQSADGLFDPLGDHDHGLQSHIYEAADLCPFP